MEWETDVQLAALKARELRGEVGDVQLGTSAAPTCSAPGVRSPVEEPKTLPSGSSSTTGFSDTLRREEPIHPELRQRGNGGYIDHGLGS